MATRRKCLVYGFESNATNLAAATDRTLSTTVDLRDLLSGAAANIIHACVIVQCRGNNTVAASLTSPVIQIQLNAIGSSSVTGNNPLANSGENESWVFARDVTSYFTSNWTGTSMTCNVIVNFTGLATINHCAELFITYDYDDAAATQLKSIFIPIEGTNATLPTVANSTIGQANNIPQLTGVGRFLPEASPSIVQAYLKFCGNDLGTTTTSFSFSGGLSGDTITWWQSDQTLASTTQAYGVIDVSAGGSGGWGAAQNAQCWADAASRGAWISGGLWVTYAWTLSGTTRILVQQWMGASGPQGKMGQTTTGDNDRYRFRVLVPELGTITLLNSIVFAKFDGTATATVLCRAGTQTYQTRASGFGAEGAQLSFGHRIDAGGAAAAAYGTLARGWNNIDVDIYTSTSGQATALTLELMLTYEANIPTSPGDASRWLYKLMSAPNTGQTQFIASIAPPVPIEANYYISQQSLHWFGASSTSGSSAHAILAERASNELAGDGWEEAFQASVLQDGENRQLNCVCGVNYQFLRYPNAPTQRRELSATAARRWLIFSNPSMYVGFGIITTYHSMTWDVTGIVSDYSAGDGSGITVRALEAETYSLIREVTTTTGGNFTFVWYDNTVNVICFVESSGRAGAALAALAGT